MESSSEDRFVDYGDEIKRGKPPLHRPAFRGQKPRFLHACR
jgi:hypothetical protein